MNKSDTYNKRRSRRSLIHKAAPHVRPALTAAAIILLICCSLIAFGKALRTSPAPAMHTSAQELMHTVIPSGQASIPLKYKGFDISFNPLLHIPNTVAWYLTAERTQGQVARTNRFNTDPAVIGCATTADYRHSGYDRGHMAPAGDMKWDSTAMLESHYLTNICPQDHSCNSGRWKTIEEMTRRWAKRDSLLVIVAGPVLTDILPRKIGNDVAVPERFFKVIIAPQANPPRAIGFIVPNTYIPDGLETLVRTVDQVETVTGYDFFSALPDTIENAIESTADFRAWNRNPRRR